MSWTDVKHVVTMEPRWKDALQFAVLMEIAKRYNPTFGYAWPSLDTIGQRVKRSPRRVAEVSAALESLGLVIRLGPDPDMLGSTKGTQRFVPIWRVENGVQQQLREAVDADQTPARFRGDPREASRGRPASVRGGGPRDFAGDQGTFLGTFEVPLGTKTASAAAQLRLPALIAEIRRTLLEEILRKRHAFFGTDPATDGNFRAIAKAVSDVLANDALGARLLKGYEAERDSDVVEAARRLCDGRHIDWGKPSHQKLDGALRWVRMREQLAEAKGQRA